MDLQAQSDIRLLLNQTVVLCLCKTLEETWMKNMYGSFSRKKKKTKRVVDCFTTRLRLSK